MRSRARVLGLMSAAIMLAGCATGPDEGPALDPTGEAPGSPASTVTSGPPHLFDVTPTAATPISVPFDPLPGARAYYGTLEQTAYRIEMPSDWNGGLLLWAHGIHGFAPEVRSENPPPALRSALIAGGYAWAASSYSQNGYVPGVATNDTLLLKQYFTERFGRRERTYVAGNSMGGNVVTLALENFPDEFDGGLSFCGVVAGEEWIDYLLAWATAAEFIAGVELPLDEGPARVTEVLETQLLPALGPPEAPTKNGEAFRSVIRNLTGGVRPFFAEGYRPLFRPNFGLITGDPRRDLATTRAASTAGINFRADPGLGFEGDAVDQGVRRFAADMDLRDPARHPETAPTTGKIRDPLLTLHETGDLTVPVSMEQSYRRKTIAAGTADLLVQRLIRSSTHCEFSDEEVARAWDDLVAWVEGGTRPAGDDVSGNLSDSGKAFTSPLRPNDPGTTR